VVEAGKEQLWTGFSWTIFHYMLEPGK